MHEWLITNFAQKVVYNLRLTNADVMELCKRRKSLDAWTEVTCLLHIVTCLSCVHNTLTWHWDNAHSDCHCWPLTRHASSSSVYACFVCILVLLSVFRYLTYVWAFVLMLLLLIWQSARSVYSDSLTGLVMMSDPNLSLDTKRAKGKYFHTRTSTHTQAQLHAHKHCVDERYNSTQNAQRVNILTPTQAHQG